MKPENKLILSESDVLSIRDFLQAIHGNKSLNMLIQQWLYFVREVQRGYDLSIYEYTNDLTVRDILQDILEKISTDGRVAIISRLQPIDETFRASTMEIQKPLLAIPVPSERWWWYRAPIKGFDKFENEIGSQII